MQVYCKGALSLNPKLFADDMCLFSVLHNLNTSTNNLNEDLKKTNDWAIQWKMSFNPDPTKQAQEVPSLVKLKMHSTLNLTLTMQTSKTSRFDLR